MPGFTQKYAPVALVWSQEFPSRLEALEAERRIKGWSRAKKLALIRNDWATITTLAKSKKGTSTRSEERREGKEWVRACRYRWWPEHQKKKYATKTTQQSATR